MTRTELLDRQPPGIADLDGAARGIPHTALTRSVACSEVCTISLTVAIVSATAAACSCTPEACCAVPARISAVLAASPLTVLRTGPVMLRVMATPSPIITSAPKSEP